MPYKDEKLYWKVRILRHFRKGVENQSNRLGFPNVLCLTAAINDWLDLSTGSQQESVDRVRHLFYDESTDK